MAHRYMECHGIVATILFCTQKFRIKIPVILAEASRGFPQYFQVYDGIVP